jgi:hypothetical protein
MALNGHSVRLLGSWQEGAQLLEQQQQQRQQQQQEEEKGAPKQKSQVGWVVSDLCAVLQICC